METMEPNFESTRHSETPSMPVFQDPDFGVKELWPKIQWQKRVSWILHFPFTYLMIFLMRQLGGYRIRNQKEVRRRFQEIIDENRGVPLLICGNHLTYADSAILIWALAPMHWYFFNYNYFSWNLPAGDHFKKKWIFRVIAFLSKCIFIHRDGTKDHHNAILNTARKLLEEGELVTVFPEGKRSRSGKVELDKVSFGLGKILTRLDRCRVLCFYLRSNKQSSYSKYPPKNSEFYLDLQVIEPTTTRTGRDAYFDVVMEIATTIKRMEDHYFSGHH